MAQKQKTTHLIAEAVSLITALILLLVGSGRDYPANFLMIAIAVGTIGIDLFVMFSWRVPRRTARMAAFHIITEAMGMIAGLVLIALAIEIEPGLARTYVFTMGLIMFLADGWFLTTWIPRGPFFQPALARVLVARLKGLGMASGKDGGHG